MTKTKINFLLAGLILVLCSCNSKADFDKYKNIPNSSWNKNHIINFNFTITDTISKKNLFINLRNNTSYAYSNLFLIAKMQFPDGKKIIDTLEYDMADASGKFLGTGFSDIKENKLFYKEKIIFPLKGEYSFEVYQAMRKLGDVEGVTSLKGILNVGFRIEKAN